MPKWIRRPGAATPTSATLSSGGATLPRTAVEMSIAYDRSDGSPNDPRRNRNRSLSTVNYQFPAFPGQRLAAS